MKINAVIRDYNNLITEIKVIKYKKKEFNNLDELAEYLSDIYIPRFECDYKSYCCEFDIECKKKYLYNLTKRNNEFNLDINFEQISFDEYLSLTNDSVLTINCVEFPDGIGSASGREFFDFISLFLQIRDIIYLIYVLFGL